MVTVRNHTLGRLYSRPLTVRMKEHQCAVKNEDMQNTHDADIYSVKESHGIDWENARIIDRE